MYKFAPLFLIIIFFFCSCVNQIGVEEPESPEQTEESEQPEQPEQTEEPKEDPVQVMNMLKNGNCEEWDSASSTGAERHYLEGWSKRENKGTVFQESNIVYEGEYSAKLSSYQKGITSFISQKVDIKSRHRLRLFFRYRMDYTEGTGARMYCYFRENGSDNISNDVLRTYYDDATYYIIRGGGYGLTKFPDTADEWKTFDYTITAPAIANYLVFEIRSYAGSTLYVDDCYVVDLDM